MIVSSFVVISCSKKQNVIKIGCITPLSGRAANYGKETKMGVDLAIKEINSSKLLDGKKIEVQYEDDQADPKIATEAIHKLINIDKVPIILGGFTSRSTLAIAPIAEQSKVVLLSASSTADDIKNSGDYIFRNVPTNSSQGKTMSDFAYSILKSKNAAILYDNGDYGISLKDAIESHFKENGGKITLIEAYNSGDKDFRTQLTKIWKNKPDVIFFPGNYQESGLILKQATELGVKSTFIGGDGSVSSELVEISGISSENTFYSNMAIGYGIADNEISNFNELFYQEYKEKPSVYSAYAYDAMKLIADAISRSDYSSGGIKQALYETNNFIGVTGLTNFNEFGEVDKSFYIYKIVNGNFEINQEQP